MRLLVAGSSLMGIKDRPSPYKMTQQHLLPKFGSDKPPAITPALLPNQNGAREQPVDSGPTQEGTMNSAVLANNAGIILAEEEKGASVPQAETESPVIAADSAVRRLFRRMVASRQAVLHEEAPVENDSAIGNGTVIGDAAPEDGRTPTLLSNAPVAELPQPEAAVGSMKPTVSARPKVIRAALRKVLQRWTRIKNPFHPTASGRKRPEPVQGELLLDTVTVVRNDLNETDLELVPAPEPQPSQAPAETENAAESARLVWGRITARLFGGKRSRRV
jgi:hypothetical protein